MPHVMLEDALLEDTGSAGEALPHELQAQVAERFTIQ
jgi:hypothetical protein